MSNKKQFTGRDSFYRMKYLHQIADMCRQYPCDNYGKLMLHYGNQLVSIGKKTQSRMSPSMKRTICKGCNAILKCGDTERLIHKKFKKQPDQLITTCEICGTRKVFNLRDGFKLWSDREESVINTIDLRLNVCNQNNNPATDCKKSKNDNSIKHFNCDKDKITLEGKTEAQNSKIESDIDLKISDNNKFKDIELLKDFVNSN